MASKLIKGVSDVTTYASWDAINDKAIVMWFFNNPVIQALLLQISIIWPNKYAAPWVPTSMVEVHKMLQLAKVRPDDLVYDLGCGDGRVIIVAAHQYGSRAIGIEIDPLRYGWCQILITSLGLRDRVQVTYGDFFKKDLNDADGIICSLLPATNHKLESKFMQELQANSRVVSHDFLFPRLQLLLQVDQYNLFRYHPQPYIDL